MTYPLREPARLLRDTSLAAGFEERLAERLATAHRQGATPVVRWPGRKQALLVLAAIALPAAAASGYWVQHHFTPNSLDRPTKQLEAKPLGHLPKASFTSNVQLAAPAPRATEAPPASRAHEPKRSRGAAPKSEQRAPSQPLSEEEAAATPQSSQVPRIESLDAVIARTPRSTASVALPAGANALGSLRRAAEQGESQSGNHEARGSQRDVRTNESRGNYASGQARDRVQARERKGQ